MAKAVFDKAEALRRYREGEKVTDIAVDMGVSKTEVYNAIRELKRAEEWGAVKASDSGAAENGAAVSADVVSGADNREMPTEGEKPYEGISVGEAAVEKPVPKKRGRKKKAEEPAVVVAESETTTEDGQETEEDKYMHEFLKFIAEPLPLRTYVVKFKDGTELVIKGVAKVNDKWHVVQFIGRTGKAVGISASELLYYYMANTGEHLPKKDRLPLEFSVE